MNVFKLLASLSLKADDFFSGLSAAEKALSNFGGQVMSAINTVKKVDSAIVGISNKALSATESLVTNTVAVATAIDKNIVQVVDKAGETVIGAFQTMATEGVAFFKDVMQEGIEFDAAMGQVSATMMKSKDEFDEITVSVGEFTGTLTEYAQKLGAETIFTSTQVGEAMNYITLSGRKAQETAELLPHTLDLAAAGAMDLGVASEMVTQAVNALGLEEEDVTKLIDQMAMTSTNSGTTIAQLGDGILTIGATARDLKGGITELNTALGVLADNGIQASEGGNMLKRILTRLATGDSAATMMETLGVSAYDAQGNMKGLQDVFMELNQAMAGFTDQQRKSAITEIFGQYSLSGANALLNTTAERWQNLTSAIEDSEGAAAKVAEVQRSTLKGQIQLLDSAYSGVKTNLFSKIAGISKEFVETLSTGLSNVAQKIKEGDFFEAFMELGETAAQLIKKGADTILENVTTINEFIDGIVIFVDKVGTALFESGSKLLPRLLGHLLYFSEQIITNFAEFLSDEKNIETIEETISHLIEQLETFFDKNQDKIYIIFSTLFDLAIEFIDDLFLLKRETIYSILSKKLLDIIKKLPDKLREWLASDGLTKTVDNVLSFIGDLAQALIDSSTEIVPQLLTFALKLAGDVITGIVDFISDEENVEKITTIIDQVLSTIDTFLHSHEKQFELIADTVIDIFLKFLPKTMRLKRETTVRLLWHEWRRIWDPVGEKFGKWLALQKRRFNKWVDKEFKKPFAKIKTFFSTWWGTIITFWSDKLLSIKDWIDESKELITTAFENIDLSEIGKNIIKGLWTGIANTKDWLIEKIGGFTDSVTNAFKDFFGIQSPSKVMRDEVGKFLAEGVGVGFTNEMDKVANSMAESIPTTFDIMPSITSRSQAGGGSVLANRIGQTVTYNFSFSVDGSTHGVDIDKFNDFVGRIAEEVYYKVYDFTKRDKLGGRV